ncbi:MAG: hypothetical protein NTZ65_03445 [Candidatus Berkelbacteria bacterium]|nr:hypothetical protein [Candidatus Berkelbacteria bacterium]
MKLAVRKGFGFGLTSGVIATMGLMVGLDAGTHSSDVVLAGIIVIAIADSMSDAVAIHMSEETDENEAESTIWPETIASFSSKFLVALLFVLPVKFLDLNIAIVFNVILGLVLITILSFIIAKIEKRNVFKMVASHILITVIVIIVTKFAGQWAETLKHTA